MEIASSLPPFRPVSHTSDSDTHLVESGGNEERSSALQEPLLASNLNMGEDGGAMKDEQIAVVEIHEQYRN